MKRRQLRPQHRCRIEVDVGSPATFRARVIGTKDRVDRPLRVAHAEASGSFIGLAEALSVKAVDPMTAEPALLRRHAHRKIVVQRDVDYPAEEIAPMISDLRCDRSFHRLHRKRRAQRKRPDAGISAEQCALRAPQDLDALDIEKAADDGAGTRDIGAIDKGRDAGLGGAVAGRADAADGYANIGGLHRTLDREVRCNAAEIIGRSDAGLFHRLAPIAVTEIGIS